MNSPVLSLSVVSHGQAGLVELLLRDIAAHCRLPLEVVLTLNIPEKLQFDAESFPFPLRVLRNPQARGFGANHNAAFALAVAPHFCILNPDIRIPADPFPQLLAALADPAIGVAAPLIVNPAGEVEDSMRRFPTPSSILRKALFGAPPPEYHPGAGALHPDWVAGMFMVFRSATFRAAGGFDESYFLYYEDVDLCWRLGRNGLSAVVLPSVRAVHDARRTSHRNLRYMSWHGRSMLRFFAKRVLARG